MSDFYIMTGMAFVYVRTISPRWSSALRSPNVKIFCWVTSSFSGFYFIQCHVAVVLWTNCSFTQWKMTSHPSDPAPRPTWETYL